MRPIQELKLKDESPHARQIHRTINGPAKITKPAKVGWDSVNIGMKRVEKRGLSASDACLAGFSRLCNLSLPLKRQVNGPTRDNRAVWR